MGIKAESMFICLDTSVWNILCDQGVDPNRLYSSLCDNNAQLVMGTNAIYELGKTFQMKSGEASRRAQDLFSYVKEFVRVGIPLMRPTGDLLREEAKHAAKQSRTVEIFYPRDDYRTFETEIEKLSTGTFGLDAGGFIAGRKRDAQQTRDDLRNHIKSQPDLWRKLAAVREPDLESFVERELDRGGRKILVQHLEKEISNQARRDLTWLAKRLLASSGYRVSRALVRSDIYLNWRCVQFESFRSDLPDDVYHLVNSSYCDFFATTEFSLARDFCHVLPQTTIAVCDPCDPLIDWFLNLSTQKGAVGTECATP